MIRACLASGLAAARRAPKLALLLWAWSLAVALPAWLPFVRWWRDALATTPGADLLLNGIDLGVLREMVQDDAVSAWSVVFAGAAGAVLVALVANAFLAGGALEVLVAVRDDASGAPARDDRRFMHRFFRGAGHFFWRSLGLLLLNAVVALAVLGALNAGLRSALAPLDDALSLAASWTRLVLPVLVLGLTAAFFWVVLDYARIRLVRTDARGAFRTWWRGFRLVLRRLPAALGLWLAVALLVGLAAGALLAWHWAVTFHTWALILLTAAAQQIFLLARAWLRTVQLAGEIELAARAEPLAIEPVPVTPAVAEVPAEEPARDPDPVG